MKRFINICLLCLLSIAATAQTTVKHRLRVKVLPNNMVTTYVSFSYTENDQSYSFKCKSDTVEVIECMVPVGQKVNIDVTPYSGTWIPKSWTANGLPANVEKRSQSSDRYFAYTMPDENVELVGLFEYVPGTPDYHPGQGAWYPETGLLICDNGESSTWPAGFNYDADKEKVTRYILGGSSTGSYKKRFPNLQTFDISRTTVTEIAGGNYYNGGELSNLPVTEILLPSTITKMGWKAFLNTKLQTLVCPAVTPPTLYFGKNDDDETVQQVFFDCPDMVVRVPEESVSLYQQADGWKDFTILPINQNFVNLSVNLMASPDGATLAKYQNMRLELTSNSTGQVYRLITTGRNSYQFRFLPENTGYSLVMRNSRGIEVAKIEQVFVETTDKTVTFDRLYSLHQPSVTLLAEGKPVEQYLFNALWFYASGSYLARGASLQNMVEGEHLRCAITLDRELALKYMRVDTLSITVGQEADSHQLVLQPLRDTLVTFNVVESQTNRGIDNATIQISQVLASGEVGQSVVMTTDQKGAAQSLAKAAVSSIVVTSPLHGSQQFVANLADSVSFRLSFIPAEGTTLRLGHTWQAAVPEGEEPSVSQNYSGGRSLEYTFTDMSTGQQIDRYLENYPLYTFYTRLAEGTKVRVRAESTNNTVEPVEAEGIVDASGNVNVTLPIVERGYIRVKYQKSMSNKPAVMVFDAQTGELLKKQSFGDYLTKDFTNMPLGDYDVVVMSQGMQYQSITHRNALEPYEKEKDYLIERVSVTDGHIAEASFSTIPLATTQLNSNLKERRVAWDSSTGCLGNWVMLNVKVQFDGLTYTQYDGYGDPNLPTDCKLEVYVPKGLKPYGAWRSYRQWVWSDGQLHSYGNDPRLIWSDAIGEMVIPGTTEDFFAFIHSGGGIYSISTSLSTTMATRLEWDNTERKLVYDWPFINEGGKMSVRFLSAEVGSFVPELYLTYTLHGQKVREMLPSSEVTVSRSGINVPQLVINPSFKVSGKAMYMEPETADTTQTASARGQNRAQYYGASAGPDPAWIEAHTFYEVKVMDGNHQIGKARISSTGDWKADCTLPKATTLSKHDIYAVITYQNGFTYKTEAKTVTYDPNAVVPFSATMTYFNHPHKENTTILFDYVNDQCTPASYGFGGEGDTYFTFEANLSNNDTTKVYACYFFVYTQGEDAEERIIQAHYNARKKRWIAYDKFNLRSMPYSVIVDPYYYSETMGSREDVDGCYSVYDNLKANNMESVNSLKARIQAVIDRGNEAIQKGEAVPIDELRELNRQLSELMGIEVNSSPVTPTSSLSEIQTRIDSLNQESNNIEELIDMVEKPFNELGGVADGYCLSKADGMTAETLEASGYDKYVLDNGSFIFMLSNDDGSWTFVDLDKNLKITIDGTAIPSSIGLRRAWGNRLEDFRGKERELRQNADAIGVALQDVENNINRKRNGYKKEIKELDKVIDNPNSTWGEVAEAEAKKFGACKVLEALEEAYKTLKDLKVSKITGSLLSIYGFLNDMVSFGDQQKTMKDMYESARLNGYYYCKHEETANELKNLYEEISSYSQQVLEKQMKLLTVDAVGLGLALGELYLMSTGVAAAPAFVGWAATIAGVAASFYSSCVLSKEYTQKCNYYQNLITLLKKKCQDYDNCKQRGDCPKCVKEGECPKWPRGPKEPKSPITTPIIDPSGFVYEGVPENRLEGVTTTVFYKETTKDAFGDDVEKVTMWNAEAYDQENPQLTNEQGEYGWMVPSGLWQVKYEKEGYQTAYSQWLPVPPPQLDVNQALRQHTAPVVSDVKATPQFVQVTFDKFMHKSTLTTDYIKVTHNGQAVSGTVNPVYANLDSIYAKKVHFIPEQPLPAGKKLTLIVKAGVKSYADIEMGTDFMQEFDIVQTVEQLVADSLITVVYDQSHLLTVQALPAAAAAGKKASVRVTSDVIATADKNEITFDESGKAMIVLTGVERGRTAVELKLLDDEDVKTYVLVDVMDEVSLVCPMPTANYVASQSYQIGTLIELSCELPEATIYYTLDGTCPCDETSPSVKKYEAPIPLMDNMVIKAFAKAPGYADSDVTELMFMVDAIQTVPVSYKVPTATYTLQGVKVDSTQQLRKGVYITNGKKVVIK